MSPQVATPGAKVTIRGTLANHTGSAVSDIVVQAQTAPHFVTRSDMEHFAATGSLVDPIPAGAYPLPAPVASGATASWRISFTAGTLFTAGTVSVYPFTVQFSSPGTSQGASAHMLIPFDPGNGASKALQVAWVWPVDNPPQQGACAQTLPSTGLNGLMSPGGRLSTLLDVGAQYTGADHLTWKVDPSLLSDAAVMTKPYSTGGSPFCSGRFTQKPSQTAASWLEKLGAATAGQEAFLTPYADVDVAALSHNGLDASIRSAYQVGKTLASQFLPKTFGPKATGTVLRAASPAGGQADAETVTSLASDGGVRTVVLAGAHTGTDNALGRTTSGTGTSVNVLQADSEITRLLGSATPTDSAKDQFALVEDYLADTAMIVSDYPSRARSLVVAPPSGWNPTASEAQALLSVTKKAHWLHPVGLSALAEQAKRVPAKGLTARRVSRDELPESYLNRVQSTDDSLSVFKNLLDEPDADTLTALSAAAAATVSSAWRGTRDAGGLLNNLRVYLRDSEHAVQIISGSKILLTGTTGETPVSVVNGLNVPVLVRVVARLPAGSQIQVAQAKTFPVPAKQTSTVRLHLHAAAIGTTTLQLQLVTQNGSPLGTVHSLSVEVTRFGRFLLIIIIGALGILVLTTIYRLRRKRRARARPDGTESKTNDTASVGGTG